MESRVATHQYIAKNRKEFVLFLVSSCYASIKVLLFILN